MSRAKHQMESKTFWLKCWRGSTADDTPDVWRFSLEDPLTGKRLGFASLEELLTHVKSTLKTVKGRHMEK